MGSPYNGPWVRVRLAVLERDHHVCQIQLPGCTKRATEVDHIVPLEAGGPRLDPTNLRASCRHCNASRAGTWTRGLAAMALRNETHDATPSRNW